MYRWLLRPFLFSLSPENAHHFTFSSLKLWGKLPGGLKFLEKRYKIEHPSLEREVWGIKFKNPVGLAAGLDKDAVLINELDSLGFGFIEIGTLTPEGQPGNDQPRLFRLPEDQALINRMGFNNKGVKTSIQRLKERNPGIIIGGNIGKNKATALEDAWMDYEKCFKALYPYVDYFVVNVSSPNTPNLRALQDKEPLSKILNQLIQLNAQFEAESKLKHRPILLKIAPDLSNEQLDDIVEIVNNTKTEGIIATNTTISRANLSTKRSRVELIGMGGLSGKPLKNRSTEVIRYLSKKTEGKLPIIGVGGIFTVEDAKEKLEAGATLIQLYTGFIYEGPELVKAINQSLIPA